MFRYDRWAPLVSAATTEERLLHVMREYLSCIPAVVRSQLPPECQVEELESLEQVAEIAVSLAHTDLRTPGGSELSALLHEMTLTFAAAQTRIRMIKGRFPAT